MSAAESLWVVGNEHFGDSFSKRGLDGKTVDAKLVREPTNKFDRNAVGVHIGRDQVGYISAYQAQKAAPWLDSVGGKMAPTLTYRDGGAGVRIPAMWVAQPPSEGRVNLQQTKKYQSELVALGIGAHTCKVVTDGEQLNVLAGDVIVGRLYPKNIDEDTLSKIVHGREQKLVIEESQFSDGLSARIVTPAGKTVKAPPSTVPPLEPKRPPATFGSLLKGFFRR